MLNPKIKRYLIYPAAVVLATLTTGAVAAFILTDIPQRLGIVASAAGADADQQHDADQEVDDEPLLPGSPASLMLSKQARETLQIKSDRLQLTAFTKYIEVPGVITSWPGRTHISVTSPLTGVINAIYVARGELVKPGSRMFTMRLTHQDLVKSQELFLAQLGQLDVEEKEIKRISAVAQSGAIAGKTLFARKYERDKLLAGINAARQAMLLHGLTLPQINRIEETRKLIREVAVVAPHIHEDSSLHTDDHFHEIDESIPTISPDFLPPVSSTTQPNVRFASAAQPAPHPRHLDAKLLVTELTVSRGQSVEAGVALAQLSDYQDLLIEGHAFQGDGDALRKAAELETNLQAIIESSVGTAEVLDDLKIIYIGNEVGKNSRALPFYLELTNEIERSEERAGATYVSWRHKPGQRLVVRLPVQVMEDVFILPREAVAEDGVDNYVFIDNFDHVDRVPVRVMGKDALHVAVANDNRITRMNRIILGSAHQLQMAIKNQSGPAIDPHAGHSH